MNAADMLDTTAVLNGTGFSKSALYVLVKKGKFPRPIKLGLRKSRWLKSDVEDFINKAMLAREGAGK